MQYEFASAEYIGDRKEQQDRLLVVPHPRAAGTVLAVLADGMGGHTGGALAAQAVVDAVAAVFADFDPQTGAPQDWLKAMVLAAHDKVAAAGKGFNRDPRSTCVVVLAQPGRMDWAHCGDSRLYAFHKDVFALRTEDHSLVEILLQQGKITEAEVLTHPERNKLYSSLGGPEAPQISFGSFETTRPDDSVLMASDGLWAYFRAKEMADLLEYRSPEQACARLMELARRRAKGNGDNLSVVVLRVVEKKKQGLLKSIFLSKPAIPSPVEDAKRFMVKYLNTVLRPEAESILVTIEKCGSVQDLDAMINSTSTVVVELMGKDRAEQFSERARELMA